MYYVVRPQGRTNYGELVLPQRPIGELGGRSGDKPWAVSALSGRWVFLTTEAQGCDDDCVARLYAMRQVRATTGKDMGRIERVLLLTGEPSPSPTLLSEHPGLIVIRADAGAVDKALAPDGPQGAASGHIFVVDPLGNLMMRFPRQADPNRMKKDISRLLRASRIG